MALAAEFVKVTPYAQRMDVEECLVAGTDALVLLARWLVQPRCDDGDEAPGNQKRRGYEKGRPARCEGVDDHG